MNFIKAVYEDGVIEMLNPINIERLLIKKDSIEFFNTEGNQYYYTGDDPESEYNIINFEEVKEKLLKLCDD